MTDRQSWVVCEDMEVWLQKSELKWAVLIRQAQETERERDSDTGGVSGGLRSKAIWPLKCSCWFVLITDGSMKYQISTWNAIFSIPLLSRMQSFGCVFVFLFSFFIYFFFMPAQSHNIWKRNLTLIFLKNIRQALWSLSVRRRWNSEWWLLMEMRWLQSLTALSRLKWSGWFPEENVITQNLFFHSWGDSIKFSF